MTADNPAARVDLDALAGLLEAHWDYDLSADDSRWECECGEALDFRTGLDLDEAQRAHLAAILADRLAPLLAERDDALTRADTWREEFDKAAALTTRWRVRAETAEANLDALRERVEALAEASIRDGRGGAWVHDEWFAAALADPEAS